MISGAPIFPPVLFDRRLASLRKRLHHRRIEINVDLWTAGRGVVNRKLPGHVIGGILARLQSVWLHRAGILNELIV